MANQHFNTLIQRLNDLSKVQHSPSEGGNRIAYSRACDIVKRSHLEKDDIWRVITAMGKSANPSGYYFTGNGISAGIDEINSMALERQAASMNDALLDMVGAA